MTRVLQSCAIILGGLLVGCAAPVSDGPRGENASRYLACVRTCLDNLMEHGTDRYGSEHTPMFMSIMDVRTNHSPEEPQLLDGMIRSEGRPHRRNPGGCDLWDDQPLLRTMYTVSELTGDARYAGAADAYTASYFERAVKPNGLLVWGSHIYYNAYTDAPGGDRDGQGPHEILVLCPGWEQMWRADPAAVTREIEMIWRWHIIDEETGLHNRHDDGQPGCDFAFSGGEFGYAFAFLYAVTSDPVWLDRAKTVFGRHWHTRNPETNLAPDAPGTGGRYDAHHCFTTLPGPHAALLLKAYEATDDPWFRDTALAHIKAYLKYGWDDDAQRYHGMLALDGTPIPQQAQGADGYDVWKPTGHADAWRATMYSYEFPIVAAQTAVYAHALTGDADALQAAQRWATHLRAQMPPSNGRRWGDEIARAMPEAQDRGGTYAENYGRAISFFLQLHYVTGDQADLDTAHALAEEAIEKLYRNGWFVGHPAKPYYESADGVAYLLYALVELAHYPHRLPPNL